MTRTDAKPKSAAESTATTRRTLPPVHRLLSELSDVALPRPVVLAIVRRHLDALREKWTAGGSLPSDPEIVADIRRGLGELAGGRIRPVINATGIVIHTNFGRSPLSAPAVQALVAAAEHYTNLEYDLATGKRGGRAAYLEHNIALLCGAEAATVVNNCAAALVLILRHFTARPLRTHVVISRGELVQIGGGFRVPEILEASGATLREVGTTNQTTLDDYRREIDDRTSMILKVHRSNFFMDGFVGSPDTRALAALAQEHGIPLIEDIGSGATFDTASLGGGEHEPTLAESLAAGADLVCFSADKLLGGPQAGIIAGRSAYVAALRREPFFRALRCDKLILAALESTVDALLADRIDDIPIRSMMNATAESLRPRAGRIVGALCGAGIRAAVGEGRGQVGGGSLPATVLASTTVDIACDDPQVLAERLRLGEPPVVAYVAADRLKLDLRTVFARQDDALLAAVLAAARS